MTKNITAQNMTMATLARLGVWLDDPYGDGMRLEVVRNPTPGRYAALALLAGEPIIGGDELIWHEYEARVRIHCFTKSGRLRAEVRRNALKV